MDGGGVGPATTAWIAEMGVARCGVPEKSQPQVAVAPARLPRRIKTRELFGARLKSTRFVRSAPGSGGMTEASWRANGRGGLGALEGTSAPIGHESSARRKTLDGAGGDLRRKVPVRGADLLRWPESGGSRGAGHAPPLWGAPRIRGVRLISPISVWKSNGVTKIPTARS